MICPACKKGGVFNREANSITDQAKHGIRRLAALAEHARCPGKDRCDCQHVVGMVLRIEGLH